MAKKKTTSAVANKSDAIRAVIAASPKATPKEIKGKLQARGIKASDALINKVKYRRKSASGKATGGRKKNATGASKADAIRDMFGQMGRDTRPRDVIAALASRGVVVTSAQVSTLRRQLPRNGAQHGKVAGALPYEHLLAAKQLAERLGGIAKARQAIDSLARLVDA